MTPRGQEGQATVELVLVLPLLGLLLLAIVQVALIAEAQVRVTHAAREGARAAAVEADPHHAVSRVLGERPHSVSVAGGATTVQVTVVGVQPTRVPLVGRLLGDVELRSVATMRRETFE